MLPNESRLSSNVSRGPLKRVAVLIAAIPLLYLIIFVSQHLVNVPWGETWELAQSHIIPAYDHTMPLSALVAQHRDNRPILYYPILLLVEFTTRWDLRTYPFIAILQAIIWIVLLGTLVWHQNKQAFYIAIIPMSCLVFAINLSAVWIRGYFGQLLHVMFMTAALYVITTQPEDWRALIISCLLSVLAFYSTLAGITALLVLPCALWLRGYRKVWQYGFLAAMFLLSLLFYFVGWQRSDLTQPLSGSILAMALGVTQFALAVLGSVFTKNLWLATVLPVVGGLITVANLYQLRKLPDLLHLTVPWLGMLAYGIIAAFMTAVGRLGLSAAFTGAPDYMMTKPHYGLMGNMFWLGVIALGSLVWTSAERKKWLVYTNAGVLVVFGALYLQNNWGAANTYQLVDSAYGPSPADETCVRQYPITGKVNCFDSAYPFWFGPEYENTAYELARRRLTTFAFYDNVKVEMPSAYEDGDIVVVDGALAAQHVPLVTPNGRQVPEANIIHLLDASQVSLYIGPPDHLIVGANPAQQEAFINDIRGAHRVWYLGAFGKTPFGGSLLDILQSQLVKTDDKSKPRQYRKTLLFIEKTASHDSGEPAAAP